MKPCFYFLQFLLCMNLARASEKPDVSLVGVYDLTPENFDSIVNGRKHALVEFYAPWCGHCVRLVPEYKKLGEVVAADQKLNSRVVIAKVNADDHSELGKRFGVTGFPTLKWFARGKPVDSPDDYRGQRSSDDFLSFINKALEEDKGYGRVQAIDDIVESFMEDPNKAEIIKIVEAKIAELDEDDKSKGEVYLKVMKKTVEKGDEYITKEHARVSKIIDSGSVNSAKLDELSIKMSVLSAFTSEE